MLKFYFYTNNILYPDACLPTEGFISSHRLFYFDSSSK
jgi:hypothetical protein